MQLLSQADYQRFLARQKTVEVGKAKIRLRGQQCPKDLQPTDFKTETTTLWSFPQRGSWATHRSSYRGNWAPQIARNLILRYSPPGDLVLDSMCGGSTTLVECKLTGRNAIGIDVNMNALMLTMDRLNFSLGLLKVPLPTSRVEIYKGDTRNLNLIKDATIDLIATHPPYANIISYSDPKAELKEDLFLVGDVTKFVSQMRLVADEFFRVLKPDHYCAILVGDTRRNRHYVPLAFRVMEVFLEAGFILKEDVIKYQWHTQTENLWTRLSREKNFFLIMHEHLFVFRKPQKEEMTALYKESAYHH